MADNPALLCADDDGDVLRAVARDLRARYGGDYRVLRADSGEEALDAVRELDRRGQAIALLLSDQRMPRMDGVRFLTEAAAIVPRAKRVLLTAYADTDAAIAAINQSRVDHYLMKPWDPPEQTLYSVLDDLLADWRAGYRPGVGGVRVVSDCWSPDGHRIRDFLPCNGVPYTFLDVETSVEAKALVADGTGEPAALPFVVLDDGARLDNPPPAELAERVGLRRQAERAFYDLAIVGGGLAGLAAAVYGASEGLKTVLVEREDPAGRPARRRASRINSAFRPVSPEPTSRAAGRPRRRSSASRSSPRARSRRSASTGRTRRSRFRTAARSPATRSCSRWASTGGASTPTGPRPSPGAASTTERP